MDGRSEIASLPSLKTLRFHFQSHSDMFNSSQSAAHIHTPHLTSLEIDADMCDTSITNAITTSLQGGLQNLQHIHLYNAHIGASFSALLPSLVGLRSLTLYCGSSCDATIFDVFCPQDVNARPACEELSKLEFHTTSFPIQPMISFILRSAQGSREVHKKMYPVQVSCDYYEPNPILVHIAKMHSEIIVFIESEYTCS